MGLPRELYRCVLAVSLGLVALLAAIIFLPYLIAGSTVGWRDGRLLLAAAAGVYGVIATLWLEHRFGRSTLKLRPSRRQRVELTVVVLAAIAVLVGASMAIIPGAGA